MVHVSREEDTMELGPISLVSFCMTMTGSWRGEDVLLETGESETAVGRETGAGQHC